MFVEISKDFGGTTLTEFEKMNIQITNFQKIFENALLYAIVVYILADLWTNRTLPNHILVYT